MRFSRILMLALLALVAGVAIAFLTPSSSLLGLFAQAVIYAIFALGVGVLLRMGVGVWWRMAGCLPGPRNGSFRRRKDGREKWTTSSRSLSLST